MPYSPLIALILGFVLTPIMGLITKGKYYIKATDDGVKESRYDATGLPIATVYHCVSCDEDYEIRPCFFIFIAFFRSCCHSPVK